MSGTKDSAVRKARVFLVDDSQELRESLRKLLEYEQDFEVCGEADNVEDALDAIAASHPDVAIVDIQMGLQSGFHVLRCLRSESRPIPVLIYSMHPELSYVGAALQWGARGFLSKSEPPERILQALRRILNGKSYFRRGRCRRRQAAG